MRGTPHGSQATPSRRLLAASVTLGLLMVATPDVVRAAEPLRGAPLNRPVAETFGEHPLFGEAASGVNTATGDYVRADGDLVLTRLLGWVRTYNSLDPGDGPAGRHWSSSFSARLAVAADGSVAFHDDDGRVLTFTPGGSGGFHTPQDLDADLHTSGSGYTLRYRSGEVWTFSAAGRLTARALNGETVTPGYDAAGRLNSVTSSQGPRLAVDYTAAGQIAAVRASDGRTVDYQYGPNGVLTAATGAATGTVRYQNDAQGQLVGVLGPDGQPVVGNSYDPAGQVSSQESPGQGTVRFSYDAATGTAVMTSADPSETGRATYVHDGSGHLIGAYGPLGQKFTQGFDAAGRLTSATLPGGVRLRLAYDAAGDVTTRTLDDTSSSYRYDAQHRLTAATDEGGATTRYAYSGDDVVPDAVTDPDGGTTRYTVVGGLVTRVVDADGGLTTLRYNGDRRVVAITDPDRGVTRFRYDAAGDTVARVSPSGATRTYAYDDAGRMTAQTAPSGAVTSYSWSPAGQLLATTAPDGAADRNTYNSAGQRTAAIDPLGRSTGYAYDAQGDLVTSTEPGGAVTAYSYDALGRMRSSTDPAGVQTQYAYDAAGNQTAETAPTGTTRTVYDARGNVVSDTDAMGRTTSYQYDPAGRLIATTDPTGAVSRTAYDVAGRVVSTTDRDGRTTTRTWTAAGLLASVTDPLGRTTRYTYDGAGHQLTVTDPAGGVTRYSYSGDGERTSTTSPAGLVTGYRYDADGRLTDTVDPTGGDTHDTYDARGNKTSETSPSGSVRRMTYDLTGQLVTATDPDGHTTGYGYDSAGNLATVTDARGAVTRMTHDADRHLTSLTDPLGRTTKDGYDSAGNLTTVTDPSGRVLTMAYDADNELTKRQGADGASVGFGYDADGRRSSMTDATGHTSYGYDPDGLLTSVTEPNGRTLGASYDAAGERTGLRYPDGLAVDFGYDPNSRLISVHDSRAGQASYTLDPDGRLLTEELPQAWERRYHYTNGVLDSYRQSHFGLGVDDTGLTHDADGRITGLTGDRRGPGQAFGYDPAGQLLTATGQPGGSFSAAYDAVGNRTSVSLGHRTTRYSYDAADELTSAVLDDSAIAYGDRTTGYRYDTSGRLVSATRGRDTVTTGYDGLGQAVRRTDDPGLPFGAQTLTTSNTYNGDGQLVARTQTEEEFPGSTTTLNSTAFTWSTGDATPQLLSQSDELHPHDTSADFSYGYSRLAADGFPRTGVFAHDVLGSTVATPETAPWAQDSSYDVLGAPEHALPPTLTAEPQPSRPAFGYRGELATGDTLDLRARDYDTGTGRFTTRDPVSNYAGRPDPASPYAYADNDPVNATDPLGRSALSAVFDLLRMDIWSIFDAVLSTVRLADADECPDPGNGTGRHQKCFQGVLWWTRGFITDSSCLDGDDGCLNTYWHTRRPEYAAQAFTIHELDWNRESGWDSFWNEIGRNTDLSQDVDWEVGPYQTGRGANRIDIVTEEKKIFEVKNYQKRSKVAAQISGYISLAAGAGITFDASTELSDWADSFQVSDGWWDIFDFGTVYVWGVGNPDGHIYFAKDDDAPDYVQNKVFWNQNLPCFSCAPPVPIEVAPPVPVE